MTSPIGWDVDDPQTGEWVDLFATFARSQAFGGDPLASPAWRGEDDVVPRRTGRIAVESTIDAGKVTVPIILRGAQANGSVAPDQEAAFLDNWRDLRRLVYRPGGFQLRRRLRYPEGVANHVATAKVDPASVVPGMVRTFHGKAALVFEILSGLLYDEDATTITPGTRTVGGDQPTRNMTITLPGAGTLANTDLGLSLVTTVATVIDVVEADATAGLATLDWSGDELDAMFALRPGTNHITWSGGGGASIDYRAGHL